MSMRSMMAARAAVVVLVAVGLAGCGGSARSAVVDETSGSQPATSVADPMAGMDHGAMGSMAGMDGAGGPVGDGTRKSEVGFALAVKTQPTGLGRQRVGLVVTAPGGEPVRDAEVEQTKKMHLIVVRRDLTGYQHVHPELAPDGTWSADVDFSSPGRWHLIVDVTPTVPGVDPVRVVLGDDVEVPGEAPADAPVPGASQGSTVDGFDVALDGELRFDTDRALTFTISKDGQLATGLTEYLGAGGHLVAIEQDTLGYTHLHPDGGPGPELSFTARAPRAGRYRLFLQFATGDAVHTAAFTVDVA